MSKFLIGTDESSEIHNIFQLVTMNVDWVNVENACGRNEVQIMREDLTFTKIFICIT